MKLLPILTALLLSSAAVSAQTVTKTVKTTKVVAPAKATAGPLKWATTSKSFGEIKQNVPVTATFTFTNVSKKPVLLTSVVGSCGCTVPTWSKDPILPGKSSEIKATFNAANAGAFNKTVTVVTNADTNGPQILTLQGTVLVGATAAK